MLCVWLDVMNDLSCQSVCRFAGSLILILVDVDSLNLVQFSCFKPNLALMMDVTNDGTHEW